MVTTTRTTSNGNVIYTIAITVEQEKGDLLAAHASERAYNTNSQWWIYDGGVRVEWDSLTNAQKIDVLGKEAQRDLKEKAYAQYQDDSYAAVNLDTPDNLYGNGS